MTKDNSVSEKKNNEEIKFKDVIMKPELKKLSKLDFAYFLLSGLFARMILTPEFLDIRNNFERNLIVYLAITSLIAGLSIATAPHKFVNNFFLWIRYLCDSRFNRLRRRVSSTYSAMVLTLNDFWGNVIFLFIVIVLSISALLNFSKLSTHIPCINEILSLIKSILEWNSFDWITSPIKKVIFPGTGENDSLIDLDSEFLIFFVLILFLVFLMWLQKSKISEYGLRLKYGLLFGYTNEYEYKELLKEFNSLPKGVELSKDDLFDKQWLEEYKSEFGISWTKVTNIYRKQQDKISHLLGILIEKIGNKNNNVDIQLLCYSLKINGIYPIIYKKVDQIERCLDQLCRMRSNRIENTKMKKDKLNDGKPKKENNLNCENILTAIKNDLGKSIQGKESYLSRFRKFVCKNIRERKKKDNV